MKRFRISLRAILVLVFIVAIASMITDRHRRKLQRVAEDIDSLRGTGAIVVVDSDTRSPMASLAPDFRGYPIEVRIYIDNLYPEEAEEFVEIITHYPTITSLTIDGPAISETHAKQLLQLPLDALSINETAIGDTLKATASPTLTWLSFHRSRINDHSLAALGDLPKLEHLDLTRSRVSDRSIGYLASLPSLKSLVIRRCKITKTGMQRLQELRPDVGIGWEPLR